MKKYNVKCPFCLAQMLVKTIPLFCAHCGTKFKKEDDLHVIDLEKLALSKYEPYKDVSVTFRS